MPSYSAQGHLIILFNVVIFGALACSHGASGERLALYLIAVLVTAFFPLIVDKVRGA